MLDDYEKKEPQNSDSFWKVIAILGLILDAIAILVSLIK